MTFKQCLTSLRPAQAADGGGADGEPRQQTGRPTLQRGQATDAALQHLHMDQLDGTQLFKVGAGVRGQC